MPELKTSSEIGYTRGMEKLDRIPVQLTRRELEKLPEYSCSLPTGTTIGKRWKRNVNPECRGAAGMAIDRGVWWLGEYAPDTDPDRVRIIWRPVILLD